MNEHTVRARIHLDAAAALATQDGAHTEATIGLAEATLALVAEKRTANLIAHRAYIRGYLLDTRRLVDTDERAALLPVLLQETGELGDRIRDALDLSPTHRTRLRAASQVDEDFVP